MEIYSLEFGRSRWQSNGPAVLKPPGNDFVVSPGLGVGPYRAISDLTSRRNH